MNVKGKENAETRVKVEVETQQHEGGCVRWEIEQVNQTETMQLAHQGQGGPWGEIWVV